MTILIAYQSMSINKLFNFNLKRISSCGASNVKNTFDIMISGYYFITFFIRCPFSDYQSNIEDLSLLFKNHKNKNLM